MNKSPKVEASPEWQVFCRKLQEDLETIRPEDIDACRSRLHPQLTSVYDAMSEKRKRNLAALALRSRSALLDAGSLHGEPGAFPDIREDMNFILNAVVE